MDASQLLASVKRRAFVPDAGQEYTDTEILALADEGLVEVILPMYASVREGFLQLETTYAVNGDTYQIPPRAMGAAVIAVRYMDTSGLLYPLTHIDDSQRQWSAQLTGPISPATVWRFVGDQIVLQPAPLPGATGSLIVTYVGQPDRLTVSTDATKVLQIEDVDFTTKKLTIGVNPTTNFPITTVVDLSAVDGSHGWRVHSATITAIHTSAPYTVTLDTLPATCGAIVGDVLGVVDPSTPGGWTIYPPIPDAMHTLLALETARRFLDGIADPRAEVVAAELERKAPKILEMVSPRASNQPKRAVNYRSAIRTMRARGWWWGWQPGTY